MEPERLCCPNCGSADDLRTIETVIGVCASDFYADGKINPGGYTEMIWDSSTTTGIDCRNCGWETEWDTSGGFEVTEILVPASRFVSVEDKERSNLLDLAYGTNSNA